MANRFSNLIGANKIQDEYTKLNTGFDLVQSELDVSASRMNTHVNGSTERHDASDVNNDSLVTGGNVDSALNTLKSQLDNIVVAASNATIGVYVATAIGTNTITTTYGGLTYFTGLKINLTIANDNTGATTFNLNSLGAKNIYKIVLNVKTALSPRDLRQGEIAQLQYDGTDFILMNILGNPEYPAATASSVEITNIPSTAKGLMKSIIASGRTTVNLFTDAIAGCESITGWSGSGSTVALDSANKLEGTNCIKQTIAGASGGVAFRTDLLPLLTAGRYYLLTSHVKNGNCNIGVSMRINFIGDIGNVETSATANLYYTRLGILIQPSDFDAATQVRMYIVANGLDTQYCYYDNVQLQEISSADYALGVAALLNKFNWHLGMKNADDFRIKTEGKNLFNKYRTVRGYSLNSSGVSIATAGSNHSEYIRCSPSQAYTFQGRTQTTVEFYAADKSFISSSTGVQTVTSPANTEFLRFNFLDINNIDAIQMERGSVATTAEVHIQSQAVSNLPLKSIDGIKADTSDAILGVHTKNISDLFSLGLASATWAFNTDYTGFKMIYLPVTFGLQDKLAGYKYDNKKLATTGAGTAADQISTNAAGTTMYISVGDADTGWLEAWTTGTAFTGMGWATIIKAYFNGWKLTTANTNVASCIWTGIASGTTQSGAVGYAYVGANLDAGFTPYKVLYQLLTPIITFLRPSAMVSQANGTLFQQPFASDYVFYGSGATQTALIDNLLEIRKWDISDGTYVYIPVSAATVTNGTLSSISGAVAGELYSFDYNPPKSSSATADISFIQPINAIAQVETNTNNILSLDKKINDLEIATLRSIKSVNLFLYDRTVLGNFTGKKMFKAPANLSIVGVTLYMQDDFSGVDGANTVTITFVNPATATIATRVYTAAPAQGDSIPITSANSILLRGQELLLSFLFAGTVNPPSLYFQIDYTTDI